MKKIFYLLILFTIVVSCEPVPNIKEVDKETKIPYYITTILKDSSNIETMRYVDSEKKMYVINEEKEIIKTVDKEEDTKTLVLMCLLFGFAFGVFLWSAIFSC